MLSKIDIEKELGDNIDIFPFNYENFKENSINLCASRFAWTLSHGKIYYNKKNHSFCKDKKNNNSDDFFERSFTKGHSALWKINKTDYIIILPHSTTLIETEEVLSIGSNIGGTYHLKVGIVSQGFGHIGTMLGPNFTGNSLIAIHNISDEILKIKVGESFVSVVFHYLDSSMKEINPTVSGHLDKMAQLGIHLTPYESSELSKDWRKKKEVVKEKMMNSNSYRNYKNSQKNKLISTITQYINKQNIAIVILLAIIIIGSLSLCIYIDKQNKNNSLLMQWWDIFKEGVIITIIVALITNIKKRN